MLVNKRNSVFGSESPKRFVFDDIQVKPLGFGAMLVANFGSYDPNPFLLKNVSCFSKLELALR